MSPPASLPRSPSLDSCWNTDLCPQVDGPRSEAALERQKRLMVTQWLASQLPTPPPPPATTTTTTTTQPHRPEADGAADLHRDHSGAPAGDSYSECVPYQRMDPASPQQLGPHNDNYRSGGGSEAAADVDEAEPCRRVEGIEGAGGVAGVYAWQWLPGRPQPPLAVAADDIKLELSFEVELQLSGHQRLSGEGWEGEGEEQETPAHPSRPRLVACRDAFVQVTEEEIAQYMGEGDVDHPLRVLSQENMTVVSTFADSASGSYSLDGMRVQRRRWAWGWESPPPPPPLCRSQSASAADVRLTQRRPSAAGRATDDADVDDWEGSLASEPPPATDRRPQRRTAAITPDLIRGARPAHRSLPARSRSSTAAPAAPTVCGPERPWTLQRPDGASDPCVVDSDPAGDSAPAAACARPPASPPHATIALRRDTVFRPRQPPFPRRRPSLLLVTSFLPGGSACGPSPAS
ncbi:uncharacterized protein LOC126092733 [Schistocerca cancellata]|uniref:uncharacterized protein LOC126092733 n=1 Tax=Schistocerca cancellata TaxID=274614 RepID=UPI002118A28E|nr:uncharacterized protein LOC126092733 [Schistocerca cancellata]